MLQWCISNRVARMGTFGNWWLWCHGIRRCTMYKIMLMVCLAQWAMLNHLPLVCHHESHWILYHWSTISEYHWIIYHCGLPSMNTTESSTFGMPSVNITESSLSVPSEASKISNFIKYHNSHFTNRFKNYM